MFKLTRLRQISITLPRASYQQITDVWVPQLNDLINRVTGYSEIESRKKTVQEKDFELSKKRVSLETSKRIYEACIDERRKCQKEINSLLQRKDAWIDTDVLRFTELYRKDLSLEQSEVQAKQSYKQASEDFERCHIDFLNQIRERYIDEQLFSDKIRKASTWWTMGLISIHMFIFLAINLREPGKTRRSQMELKQLIKDTVETEHSKLSNKLDALVHTERDGSRGEDVSISHSAAFTESKVQEKDVMSLREKVLKQPEFVFGSGLIVGLCVAGFLSVGRMN